ncbi:MAG: PAS domain S-box protein [Proteobacteria bacterium]|nr:PAS domain S-box protein [Pseudomonadota bacterium]
MSEKKTMFDRIGLNVQDAFIMMDPDGKISYWNQAAATMFGWKEEEILGKNLHNIIVPARYYPLFEKGFNHFLKTGKGPAINKVLDVSAKHKDGHEFSVELALGSVSIHDQWYAVGVLRDVALKKQIEFQLIHAERVESIGTLAGGFAHDFNNILASIIGYTELALDDATKDTLLYSNLTEALTAANRAKDLVRQILKFSGQLDSQAKPIHMKSCVIDAMKLVRASFPPSIDIRTNLQSEGTVMADPSRIHQMILNLCTNAGHAMESGGILSVGLEDVDDPSQLQHAKRVDKTSHYIKLSVSDTGKGMASDILSRAFTPFFTTRVQGEGTGMGLPLVHGIVTGLKGWIHPRSEPGKGSTFEIYLPILEQQAVKRPAQVSAQGHGSGLILFVDDEKPIVKMGVQLLERMGYKVEGMSSSPGALERFKASPDTFNLVITDMNMPFMNGLTMAREMIQIRPDIPIILSTGYGISFSESHIHESGIKAIVYKPLLFDEVAETIGRLLSS